MSGMVTITGKGPRPEGAKMPIVDVVEAEKKYPQGSEIIHALWGVSLSVERGEFVALAGPSGSGKTTLLNLMGGLDVPDSGHVRVDGFELGTMSPTELATLRLNRIGFVFQSYNLIPVLSAAENVAYVMRLQGVPKEERRERVHRVLAEVGLGGMEKRRPADLSGGQQQRVAVARAIVSEPSIILADEPTANLDSTTGENLIQMMRQMNRERQATFVFATHDTKVMQEADRVISMRDGKVERDEGQKDHGA